MPGISELCRLPLHFTALALSDSEPKSDDVRRFTEYVALRARLAAGADGDRALVPATEHTGYLARSLSGETIFVPYNLAPVFPAGKVLQDAFGVARSVRLSPKGPICISGSTTFLGQMDAIGDLDFCEYCFLAPDRIATAVEAKAALVPPLSLVTVKPVSKGTGPANRKGHKLAPPWGSLIDDVAKILAASPMVAPANPIKLEFVSSTDSFGMLSTTSLVLPLSASEQDNCERSYVFQEAVISSDSPPFGLIGPSRFGKYLAWLYTNAKELLGATELERPFDWPVKALKRLLSFMLAVGRSDLVEEILDQLRRNGISEIMEVVRDSELRRIHDAVSGPIKAWIGGELKAANDNQALVQATQEALEATADVARTLVEDIELMLREVRSV